MHGFSAMRRGLLYAITYVNEIYYYEGFSSFHIHQKRVHNNMNKAFGENLLCVEIFYFCLLHYL